MRRAARQAGIAAGSALAVVVAASSGAQAQCAFGGEIPRNPGGERIFNFVASASNAVTSAVMAMNTGFQTQTSAFVASPPGTEPNQFAGGVWARGIGGRLDIDSQTSGTRTRSDAPGFETVSCSIQSRNDYYGVQGGIDIGRLDLGASGWNVHFGVTAGYFEADIRTQGAGITRAEVPFVGLYAALVGGGGFFLDAQVRGDFYRITVSEPSLGVQGATDATGFSFTSTAGYHWSLGNYFIEPSIGIVYSTTSVDALSVNPTVLRPGPGGATVVPTVLTLQDIESLLGRAGVRIGTSFIAGGVSLQPFVVASVWHEFSGDTAASAVLAQPQAVTGNLNFSSTRIGTFGQYSIGVAANVLETGWLGYARFDYRNGENIEGFSVNGGLRYQFAPAPQVAAARPAMVTKAPPAPAPFTWAGFYIGGFVGGAWSDNVTATGLGGLQTSYDLGSSVIAGLTIGYNYLMGPVVVGLEAEGGYLRLKGSAPFAASANQDTVSETKIGDWYSLLAARLGFPIGPALIYGKAGGAIVGVTSGVIDACSTAPCSARTLTATGGNAVELTWVAGGGLEIALGNNWSVKGEYLYLGTDTSYIATGPGGSPGLPPRQFRINHDVPGVHTAKFGINYRFSQGS